MIVFQLKPWVEEKCHEENETKAKLARRFGICERHFLRLCQDDSVMTDGKVLLSPIRPRERRQAA